MDPNSRLNRAEALCKKTIVVDSHIDVPYRLYLHPDQDLSRRTPTGDFDYVRARDGGLNAAFMAAYVPAELQGSATEKAFADDLIDLVDELCKQHPDRFAHARSPKDVRINTDAGRISLPLAIENGAALQGEINNVKYFFERGVRYMTLTHARSNRICDSSYDADRPMRGVSPFGGDVIREMNRLGMMVDVSHASDEAFYQILELSRSPVIATHSSMRHFTPGWERNLSDDMLTALAETNGLVMVCFGSSFLDTAHRTEGESIRGQMRAELRSDDIDEESAAGLQIVARTRSNNPIGIVAEVAAHIQHATAIVGIERVGLGSDFDGVFALPRGLQDVSGYPNLVAELFKIGFDESEVSMILGENLLRFWDATLANSD